MGPIGPNTRAAPGELDAAVRTDPTDFMGGLFTFVGDVLNALFRAGSSRTTVSLFSDDGSFSSATGVTVGTDVPVSMLPPEATVTPQTSSMAERAHAEIASLQTLDPDFSELGFLAVAGDQYTAYLAADGAMNADALATVATPAFVDAFRQRVAGWNAAGIQRIVSDVKILGSTVLNVSIDGTQQAIKVRVTASGVRYSRDTSTGAAVEGSMQPESFTEFATFVRPPNATTPKTVAAGGATHCPSCGAPVQSGAPTCPYCGTPLAATVASWLLDHTSVSAYT